MGSVVAKQDPNCGLRLTSREGLSVLCQLLPGGLGLSISWFAPAGYCYVIGSECR